MIGDLQQQWALPAEMLGYVTSSVQLGFIAGTLVFAFFALSDLVSPRLLFFACSLAGALANAAPLVLVEGLVPLLAAGSVVLVRGAETNDDRLQRLAADELVTAFARA